MKDMLDYTREKTGNGVFEARRTNVEPSEEKVVQQGKVVDKDKALEAGEKPNAAKRVKWAVDEPTNDDVSKYLNKEDWTSNMKEIRKRIRTGLPFFILGHAGWGKTAIIKNIAKKFGYTILTVYLDKALPEDLNGIPVPMEGEKGSVYQAIALPAWAAYMYENPDTKFLLFFDEMNQADPRVQNALMPIVKENEIAGVKIPNYVVGAAGNYHDENDCTHEMNTPLMERFAPIIVWEDKTPAAWREYFDFIRKEWEPKVGSELLDQLDKLKEIFSSPRVINEKLLPFIWEIKQLGEEEWEIYDSSDYLKFIKGRGMFDESVKLERTDEDDLEKLADYIDAWMREDSGKEEESKNTRSRNNLVAPEWVKEHILNAMEFGWVYGGPDEDSKDLYLVSRENIMDIFDDPDDPEMPTAEQVHQEIKFNEKKGIKFKYETVKEGLKDNPKLKIEPRFRKKYGV